MRTRKLSKMGDNQGVCKSSEFLTNTEISKLLSKSEFFGSLTEAEVKKIQDQFHYLSRNSGEQIPFESRSSNNILFIVQGKVRVSAYTEKGREVCFGILSDNDIIGPIVPYVCGHQKTYYFTKIHCKFLCIEYPNLVRLMSEYGVIFERVISYLLNTLQDRCRRIYDYSALDTKERTRAELLRLVVNNSNNPNYGIIPELPTHEEIANMITSHREAVTKELGLLQRSGLILKQGKALIIPNKRILEQSIAEL